MMMVSTKTGMAVPLGKQASARPFGRRWDNLALTLALTGALAGTLSGPAWAASAEATNETSMRSADPSARAVTPMTFAARAAAAPAAAPASGVGAIVMADVQTSAGLATSGLKPVINVPTILDARSAAAYRGIFNAIDAGDWTEANAAIDAMPASPLRAYARAAVYTAKGSPRVEGDALRALIVADPVLPQAGQLVRMAATRGVVDLPPVPEPQRLGWLGAAPRRGRLKSSGTADAQMAMRELEPLLKGDQPALAEARLAELTPSLDQASLTEWRQRVAWSYYQMGDNGAARRMASQASQGDDEWAAQADWVTGLAAWREQDWSAAANAFSAVSRRAKNPEMLAAGFYWAARAELANKQPSQVQSLLRSAARYDETFYGLLAQAALGITTAQSPLSKAQASQQLLRQPNIVTAIALSEIGQSDRADDVLRWQARIGSPVDHDALTEIAGALSLPATQFYLAHNGPQGSRLSRDARYPMPTRWSPRGGYRVDPALIFAHTLEESNFRTDITSPAGARGLMQVLPGTARDIARARGEGDAGSLGNPSENMEFGQSYIENLRDRSETGGLLPKVIAAYNCGPGPLSRWNARNPATDRDPLLYIESISYWETRSYVATVMRNYWVYQQKGSSATPSRSALAQNLWPRFPTVKTSGAPRSN